MTSDEMQPKRDVRDVSLGVLLQIAGRVMTSDLERISSDVGLPTGHLSLLGMVCRFPDQPLTTYCRILVFNDATLGRYSVRLEDANYLKRVRLSSDGREVRLTPTEKGHELMNLLSERLVDVAEHRRSRLGDCSYQELERQLRVFLAASGWEMPGGD
ncbi:DNA-binding MarR family transcriptional regulator [Shimia isoporae]|uniref:DNA-binding MarR family transcriptional regulator n=1 Tax=Shimia isoporae TaxID=647720 RepID=A0A4R1NKD7_9RHOB|nr:MarR family transcriptional regulator [Shimia isoporae]TCL08776.1 DNA-binding MarR family transcriptional regulator [Shimia isoporae]